MKLAAGEGYIVNGSADLEELEDLFGIQFPDEDIDMERISSSTASVGSSLFFLLKNDLKLLGPLIDIYGYSRYPVYEEDLDNIVSVLHIKDAVSAYLSDVLRIRTFFIILSPRSIATKENPRYTI